MTLFRGLAARTKWIALVATVFTMCFAATASASSFKPYSIVMGSGVGTGGGTVTATLTNLTSPQTMGSANLTAPKGYTISAATITQGPGMATLSPDGTAVLLRNLALPLNQSVTVSITLSAYTCSTTPVLWNVEVKQSNDFSGPPGNDMGPQLNSSPFTSLCSAPCKKNSTCTAALSNSLGAFNVAASSGKSTDTLQAAANASSQDTLTCQLNGATYASDDPNAYQFLTNNDDRTKTVTLTFTAPTGPGARSLADEEICFDAPFQFTAKLSTNPTVTGAAGPSSDVPGWFMGILPDCTKGFSGPCHNRSADTLVGSTMTLVATIPSGLPGDPHMG
jgi:hypothetical protein